jgi:hypothetical protein
MNNFYLENNITAKNIKHALMMNNKCIACFTNKKHALRIMRFLIWHEKRFGAFVDIEQAGSQLHRSIKNANLDINFETIY